MKKIILTAGTALLFPIVLLMLASLLIPAQYEESFLGGISIKLECAQSITSPKIMLVGGSSLPFGVDSERIQEKTGCETVNFGLYAALGTVYMMEQSKSVIHEGDMIILCPETSSQTMSMYFGGEYAWQAADACPQTLLKIRPADYLKMAASFPAYISAKYRLHQSGGISGNGVYMKSSFSPKGDIVYPREKNIMIGGYDPNTPISLTSELMDKDFAVYINKYVAYAEKKGAKVYFAFPPMNRLAVTSNEEEIYTFFLTMQSMLDCEIITSPEDSILNEKLFYDSNFHLTDRGRDVYTVILINALYRTLGFKQAIALPDTDDIPDLDSYVLLESTQADGFVTQETSDGLIIIGVTEEISGLTSISVPAMIGEKPVATIAGGAFSACKELESLIIPAGISRLDNGAFDGCSALSEIILLAEDAALVGVGDGFLDGTGSVRIRVKKEAFPSFVGNYFWSQYAAFIDSLD